MSTQRFKNSPVKEGKNPYLELFAILVQLEQERDGLERLSRQLNKAKGLSQGSGVYLRGLRFSSLMKGYGSAGSPSRVKSMRDSGKAGFYVSDKLECDEVQSLTSQYERKLKTLKALEQRSESVREEIRRSLANSD